MASLTSRTPHHGPHGHVVRPPGHRPGAARRRSAPSPLANSPREQAR
ncbi:hypothetical protein STTU_0541 [Streptomyces sp. Tu6071]|nr:hypothetical protein STTU_0541 [Streptomyces sp. Tu6071]